MKGKVKFMSVKQLFATDPAFQEATSPCITYSKAEKTNTEYFNLIGLCKLFNGCMSGGRGVASTKSPLNLNYDNVFVTKADQHRMLLFTSNSQTP